MNREKSIGVDVQVKEYLLGLKVNLVNLSLSMLESKVKDIIKACQAAIDAKTAILKEIASILGNLTWATQAIPFAQAHFRAIQWFYIQNTSGKDKTLNAKVMLEVETIKDLEWWISNLEKCNGRPIVSSTPDMIIYLDASLSGWGAALNTATVSGPWTAKDSSRHINELELLAALNALKSFTEKASNVSIQLMMDNQKVVAYVNKAGETRSVELCKIASKIIKWCEERNLDISALYPPDAFNVVADRLSGERHDASDWKLQPLIFRAIKLLWDPDVDLFALEPGTTSWTVLSDGSRRIFPQLE